MKYGCRPKKLVLNYRFSLFVLPEAQFIFVNKSSGRQKPEGDSRRIAAGIVQVQGITMVPLHIKGDLSCFRGNAGAVTLQLSESVEPDIPVRKCDHDFGGSCGNQVEIYDHDRARHAQADPAPNFVERQLKAFSS